MMTVEHLLTKTHATFYKDGKNILCHDLDEGYRYTTKKIINLKTGEESKFSFSELEKILSAIKIQKSFEKPIIVNLYYELGLLIELNEVPDQEVVLCDFLKFKATEELPVSINLKSVNFSFKNKISSKEYRRCFDEVYKNLLDGNCYQLNLTKVFDISFDCSVSELYQNFLSTKNRSSFAHSIFIENMNSLILSNSPECLFEIKHGELYTRPIKGTLSDKLDVKLLTEDEKNNSELSIITDLLRNDLSRIGNNFSEVVSLKEVFHVPGLIHQFSEIKVKLEESVSLFKIIQALFPGGSITGAPKKRVLKLINVIESQTRGAYTGSTIILFDEMKSCSINIRTANVDIKRSVLQYGAGGGITLLSKCDEEYDEMISKVESFFSLFKC